MRIFPVALIILGSLGLAKYFGLIPFGAFHVIGPVLLIALGVSLLFRRQGACGRGRGELRNVGPNDMAR